MSVIRAISQLDCLLSLSKSSAALGEPCVRPEIVESDTAVADFEELRHPCIFRYICSPRDQGRVTDPTSHAALRRTSSRTMCSWVVTPRT